MYGFIFENRTLSNKGCKIAYHYSFRQVSVKMKTAKIYESNKEGSKVKKKKTRISRQKFENIG